MNDNLSDDDFWNMLEDAEESVNTQTEKSVPSLEEQIDQFSINESKTFEELKMDDYEIVDFLMNVEEYYGFAFHENEMLEMKTMQNVMDMINKNMQED